jgi:tRNA-specific 2-thiouridylase
MGVSAVEGASYWITLMDRKRVIVAMSGGVDSSVAAALLLREGYDVFGVTMRLWSEDGGRKALKGGCCVLGADDARAVCGVLGIPHQVINFEREFEEEVVDYFCRDYERGRTPNPCLACNDRVKFKLLLERATAMGADYLATGHYARIRRDDEGGYRLLRAVDETKDQSYALFTVGQTELSRLLFPIGEHRKAAVRRMAAEMGLPVAEKRDSFEICFVDEDYRAFIGERVRQAPGDIRDTAGRVVGRHGGVGGYTVGQRHGLGVALGERRYVVAIDSESNAVTIGGEEDLLCDGLLAEDLRWVDGKTPEGERAVEAQVRYRAPAVAAVLSVRGGCAAVRFREPQRAITPGQAAVFYDGEQVIGGGIIAGSIPAPTRGD